MAKDKRTISQRIEDGWRWIIRQLTIVEQPTQITYGGAWERETPQPPPYPVVNSMAAFGQFPWVYAAVEAVANDISGLPLTVQRKVGARSRTVADHPMIRLMRRPSHRTGPTLWRRQMLVDLLLAGNFYGLVLGSGSSVASVVRLHPEHVQIIPSADGGVLAYRFDQDGTYTDYSPDDVIHIKQTTWRDGVAGLYGQGAIEVLQTELGGEYAASQRWRTEAGRGQPSMTISPKGDMPIPGDVMAKLVQAVQRNIEATGVVPINGPVDVNLLPFNARDMEFTSARDWTRSSVLAVIGVAYVRLFLPSANFATAKEQNRIYWQNLLGLIALIEDGLTRIAQRMGTMSDRVVHDTSGVDALQESRSDRMQRAAMLVEKFGLTPIDALQVEGFTEIDPSMIQEPAGQPVSPPEVTQQAASPPILRIVHSTDTDTQPEAKARPAVRYRTGRDEKVCEICAPLDGRVFAIRSDGSHAGPELPRHENCRCYYEGTTTRAADEDGDMVTKPTPARYDGIDFTPTAGMVEEAKRAVQWIEEGKAGDGMTQGTKLWARRVADGGDITFEKARAMRAWFARHEGDKAGEGFDPGEPGYPSPGRVAWAAWFGDPGQTWAEKVGRQMDAADAGERMAVGMAAKDGGDMTHRLGIVLKRMAPEDGQTDDMIQSRFKFVASTADVDRMGDIVEQSWKLDAFKSNPVILWNHDSARPPIARALAVDVVDGQLVIDMEFDMQDPFAAEVAGKLQRGFLNAGSVGFFPGQVQYRADLPKNDPRYAENSMGIVASQNELVEFSITPIPANSMALLAASADQPNDQQIRDMLANPATRRRIHAMIGDKDDKSTTTADPLSWLRDQPTAADGLPFLEESK